MCTPTKIRSNAQEFSWRITAYNDVAVVPRTAAPTFFDVQRSHDAAPETSRTVQSAKR